MPKNYFTYLLLVMSCLGLRNRGVQGRNVTNCVPYNTTAPAWATNVNYTGTSLVTYGGILYECLQSHESEENWIPPATPDLWATPTPCEITPWKSQTLYQVGSEVTYNGVTYVCIQAHESESTWTPDQTPALWQSSIPSSSGYQPPLPTNYSSCVYDPATGGPFVSPPTNRRNCLNRMSANNCSNCLILKLYQLLITIVKQSRRLKSSRTWIPTLFHYHQARR